MTQTADAIREKKGTSEKIAPVNFAEEIKSISAGGGESGGGDEWVYLDISTNRPSNTALENLFGLGKGELGGQKVIASLDTTSEIAKAIAFIPNLEMYFNVGGTELKTVLEFVNFVDSTFKIDDYPRLTKEQFYTLE